MIVTDDLASAPASTPAALDRLDRRRRAPALTAALGVGLLVAAILCAFAASAQAQHAYVANRFAANVSVIDTATNTVVGSPIAVGDGPFAIAITPDGTRAYVANSFDADLTVIDTATNTVVGGPIAVGDGPVAIAITPDGTRAYVANSVGDSVSVIDTATNTVVGNPIAVGDTPRGVAITPDGTRAYVNNQGDDDVSVIDTATNTVVGSPIAVGDPESIAIAPDGARAYVANFNTANVSVIDIATNAVVATIPVANNPRGIAIAPDGARAYVAINNNDDVSVIDTATNTVIGGPIGVGEQPRGIAMTPSGARAYVANFDDDNVSVIDTATNAVVGNPIAVGTSPFAIAIVPNQPPVAELAADPLAVFTGLPVSFDASASTDDEGIASYRFDFGDESFASGSSPIRNHAYTNRGAYDAAVTVDDGEGCPGFVFTGQTASCNGPSAVTSGRVGVEVRVFRLRVSLRRPQRSLLRITARATCSLDCHARARGVLVVKRPGRARARLALAPATAALSADIPADVAAGIPGRARTAARRALGAGGRVRARIRVIATIPTERGRQRLRVVGVRP